MLYPNLFSPIQVGAYTLKNRITAAPVGRIELHDDGKVREEFLLWFSQKAAGGAGLVTVGESFVDYKYAHREPANFKIDYRDHNDPCMVGYSTLAAAIKDNGAVALAQLLHAGAAKLPQPGEPEPIGPVDYIREDGVHVRAMDRALMEETAENFAAAAAFMQAAGFDGIHLHAGHGWLFTQFLSARTNTRTDEYGGSLANRARFPLEVIDRVRHRVGPDFLIEIRISGEENVPGGMEIDEVVAFCEMIQDKVDLIQISAGIYHEPVLSRQFSACYEHRCCNAHLAQKVREAVHIPVSTVGGVTDPEDAEELVREGLVDMVALGRQMFADPWWPQKAREGRREDIDMCIRCLRCFGGPMEDRIAEAMERGVEREQPKAPSCAINPFRLEKKELPDTPAEVKKHVLVIGGGPAGLTAADVAARRGHRVTLVEKSPALGGKLRFADDSVLAGDLARLRACCIARVEKKDSITVLQGTELTKALFDELSPDAVICAVGAGAKRLDAPAGKAQVLTAEEAYNKKGLALCGERVAVLGGGATGCETALYLAQGGKHVTVIEPGGRYAAGLSGMVMPVLMDRLNKAGVSFVQGRCMGLEENGALVQTDAGQCAVSADTFVLALGMEENPVEPYRKWAGERPFRLVGDCAGAGTLMKAIHQGALAAAAF